MTASKHALEQRRYREKLRAKAVADAPRGAPETRAVIQAIAVAVRKLAKAAKKAPDGPEAATYQRLMLTAHKALRKQGFDATESFERLSHYTLPDDAKARRRRAAAERRFWESSSGSGGTSN